MVEFSKQNIVGIVAVLCALLAVPTFVMGMLHTPEQALARMRQQGNCYTGLLFKDAELTPNVFMNSFWQQCKQKDKADKNSALNDVVEARSLLTREEFRCQISAAFKVGADVSSVELCNAVIEDDIALTRFFLSNGADPQKKPRRGADRPIYSARSAEMAQLLLSFGARLPKSIVHCMKDFYHPEIITFFASRGVNVQTKECECVGASAGVNHIYNVTPFQRLILHADKYTECPTEALKKAALLKEWGADIVNVEYVVPDTGFHPIIIRPTQEFIPWRIQQFENNKDEQSIKTKAVLQALLAFVQQPNSYSYSRICIKEFAPKTPMSRAITNRELGIRRK